MAIDQNKPAAAEMIADDRHVRLVVRGRCASVTYLPDPGVDAIFDRPGLPVRLHYAYTWVFYLGLVEGTDAEKAADLALIEQRCAEIEPLIREIEGAGRHINEEFVPPAGETNELLIEICQQYHAHFRAFDAADRNAVLDHVVGTPISQSPVRLVQRFTGMSQSKIDHIAETIQKIWETQDGWLASALEDKVKDVLITRAQQELQSKPRAIN